MNGNGLSITPSGGGVGAFVDGIDLSQPMSDNITGAMRAALGDHGVLFFRDQDLTPDQHIAFAGEFGPININRFFPAVDGHPEIAEVRKEPEQESNIGNRWHSDHSYDDAPALGSVLLARETPPQGGDTLFASMFRAYDSLSDGLKKTVEQLRAVHSSRHVFGRDSAAYYKGRHRTRRTIQQCRCGGTGLHPPLDCSPPDQRSSGALRQSGFHGGYRGVGRR